MEVRGVESWIGSSYPMAFSSARSLIFLAVSSCSSHHKCQIFCHAVMQRYLPKLREKQSRNRDHQSICFLHKLSISSPWTPATSQSLIRSLCPTPVSSLLSPSPSIRRSSWVSHIWQMWSAKTLTTVALSMLWVSVPSVLWGIVSLQSILDLNCLSISALIYDLYKLL